MADKCDKINKTNNKSEVLHMLPRGEWVLLFLSVNGTVANVFTLG